MSSDPIWTDIGVIGPVPRNGIALPHELFINHTAQYTTTLTAQVDILRAQVSPHEFFHAVQWTYVPGVCPLGGQLCTWQTHPDVKWWMEATARWAEPKVYPQNGTYPEQVDDLLANPYRSMPTTEGYSSAIFARYLESKVAAGNPNIIKKIWDQYGTHSSAGMVAAIDTVLMTSTYSSSLVTEFPKFTWNNYFMVTGTYTNTLTNVYTDLRKASPDFTGPEWRLIRSFAKGDRQQWQAGNTGTSLFDKVPVFPAGVIPGTRARLVDHWGVGYLEFVPSSLNLQPGQVADLHLTVKVGGWSVIPATDYPQVSIISIPKGAFGGSVPLPNNDIRPPVLSNRGVLLYDRTIPNFSNLDRVAVIINNTSQQLDAIPFGYSASIIVH